MNVDEIELVRRLGDVESLPREVAEKTEVVLRAAMAIADVEAVESVAAGPRRFVPRAGVGSQESRHGRRARRSLVGVATAAVVIGCAGAYVASGSGSPSLHAPALLGPGHGGASSAGGGLHRRALLAKARYVLTDALAPGAIQEVIESAGKTSVNGPHAPVSRSETWTVLSPPYNSRTVSLPAGQFEQGQTNGQFEFYDPSSNTIYRETNPSPQQQAGGSPALATALAMLSSPGVSVNRHATLNGAPAIEVTSTGNSQSISEYWFSPTTYEPLRFVSEDPGVGQFTADFSVTTLASTTATQALVSIAAQHPSAAIVDLPNQEFVAKESQVQGG